MRFKATYFFILIVFILGIWGCRKDTLFSTKSTTLRFSADTVFLDTVFTTIGSSTRILKVYNPTEENIYINRVFLGRGQSSYYRMNVNGLSTKDAKDVELPGGDSLYIFVEVTADVQGANSLLYTDSIVFETGAKRQHVNLVTLAKDAHFYYPTNQLVIEQEPPLADIIIPYSVLPPNATWGADKPHVVYGYVVIDSLNTLDIAAGAEVHFHNNSGMWVYRNGTLRIDATNQGDFQNPVIIQGDRLEPAYEDIPGQWGGVLSGIFIMNGSENNVINNAVIKNATNAVRVDSTASNTPNLVLKNTQILNSSRVGLYGGFANIEAKNLILGNAGLYLFYGLGGQYSFRHSTFGNEWVSSSRSTPAVGLFNFFEDSFGNIRLRDLSNAYFGNCIIHGNGFNEVALGIEPTGTFNYLFKSTLLKIEENPDGGHYDITDITHFDNCIFNQDPQFLDAQLNDYQLDTNSPAINVGGLNDAQLVPLDIKGLDRTVSPDLGAHEK